MRFKFDPLKKSVFVSLLVVVTTLSVYDCAGKNPPDVGVLQVGSAVLDAATKLQKGITTMTDAKTLPVPLAQKLTGYVEVISNKSGPLGDAVKSYHDLTDLNLKKLKAAEIQTLLADINTPLSKLLAEVIPEGAVHELSLLAGNVINAIAQVQLQVASALIK